MSRNRVRETLEAAFDAVEFQHVGIDDEAVERLAAELNTDEPPIPEYREPAYPPDDWPNEQVFDALMLAAANAFQFITDDAPERYHATYGGETWTGMYAMVGSLTNAVETGTPVTDGEYLRDVSLAETRELFTGEGPNDTEIPMLEARHELHNAIGERLCASFDGHFHDVLGGRNTLSLFDDEDGVVRTLVSEFPEAFDDTRTLEGHTIAFDKKAQLAAAYAFGRFQHESFFSPMDIDQMTLLGDYVVPANLRAKGVLVYDEDLGRRVETATELPEGSREEVEIRAAAIIAGDRLVDAMAEASGDRPLVQQVDYQLWKLGRDLDIPYHVTHTTTY